MTSTDFDRRRFLSTAALGGATIVGATALGGVDPDQAFAAQPRPLDPAVPASSFVEGRITAIENGTLLKVAGSYGERNSVQLTNATSVWKLHPVAADAAEVGDGMYARGLEMPDGSIAADAVWLNIVNLDVVIRGIGRDRLALGHHSGELIGRISNEHTVASYAGAALTEDLSRIRIGQHALVLGAWRPRDGAIDLARVSVGH
ncbi:cell wall protein [Streptomyces sp. NPDC051940]|uniref:cell wall protein n=1 Tax=Streptomyces sp. NPDC051940 TaxID=3155675 RepID=UPI0034180ED2